ncbi:glycosyltransferase [Flavobacterium sp. JP2137]|uniref:glycosyltransferase n=1 Tax=Flavobacterium sp. JP2137 TaxID=3414510 RepID=UPI003D2FCE92
MKIVYLSTKITGSGGTAKITALKANNFVERWGFEVSIISTNDETDKPFYPFDPRVKFYLLNDKMTDLFAIIPFYKRVQRIVKEINPKVVIVNDNGFKAYFSTLFLSGTTLWFEVHGSRRFLFKNGQNTGKNTLISKVSCFLYKKFDTLVLLNEESKQEWRHSNVVVIPNFVESDGTLHKTANSKAIIAIGRVSEEKGYDRMLTIFERISVAYPDWSLHIYGKQEDPILLKTLLDRKLAQVFFHGETRSISQSIAESAFVIHTSYNEGMPMALLEVLDIGKTVVAFNVPFGVKEIVRDQHNGFLVQDGDLEVFEQRIRLLIANQALRSELEGNAKESIKQYGAQAVLEKWKALFQSL